MRSKRSQQEEFEDEIILLNGNRRSYPGVQISYCKEENWSHGHVYIEICRDSECMSIDQFEVFIAMFRKVIEIARRKQTEMDATPDDGAGSLPQVELSYDSAVSGSPVIYTISDMGDGGISTNDSERLAVLMEQLLAEGRNMDKIEV